MLKVIYNKSTYPCSTSKHIPVIPVLLDVAWTGVTVTDEPLSLLGVAWISVTK
jgi:hypothetical protein